MKIELVMSKNCVVFILYLMENNLSQLNEGPKAFIILLFEARTISFHAGTNWCPGST